MKFHEVDTSLERYPTIQDVWRARFAWFLLAAGLVSARFYFGSWKNPMTDFAIWIPVAGGAWAVLSQIVWRTQFSSFSASTEIGSRLSFAVIVGAALVIGLTIG